MTNTAVDENDASGLELPPKPFMNIHEHNLLKKLIPMPAIEEKCPWCQSPIPHSRFAEIETKIREQEQTKLAEASNHLRAALQAQHTVELAQQRQLAQQQLESALTIKLKELDIQRQKDLADQRMVLQKDRDDSVLKAQADFNRERESLQSKMKEMERALLKKTSQDLGEIAEIDLFESLRLNFPDDRITRVAKGQNGADVHHEVLHKGQLCGKIVIDSKNTKAWQNAFVTKLRQDQMDAGADHAILSTTVFPRGQRELWIEDAVIVVSPLRVTHIVALLRRTMITIHVRGLSLNERASKMSKLYALITSAKYTQQFQEIGKLSTDIHTLDVGEKKVHETTWRKRGRILTRIITALQEIDSEVAAVIEGEEPLELPVAS
jgi:hypothetical protein